jgi:hypothetical protein
MYPADVLTMSVADLKILWSDEKASDTGNVILWIAGMFAE